MYVLCIFIFKRFCRNIFNQVNHSCDLILCHAKDFINMNPCFLTEKKNSQNENLKNYLVVTEGFRLPILVICALLTAWVCDITKPCAKQGGF